MGTGAGPDDSDDFDEAVRRFLDQASAPGAPHEPSYAERQRAARAADLQHRLDAEAEHARRLEERDRAIRHRAGRARRRARRLAPLVVVALVLGAAYLSFGRGADLVAGSPQVRARPKSWPPVDDAVAEEPLGTPPPLGEATGPHHFLDKHPDGSPIAWDPCRPIRYVVNPAGQPPGADQLIREAVARTSTATGLVFEDRGTTDETWTAKRAAYQPERYGERWAPVLISWSTADAVANLAIDRTGGEQGANVAGLGGPSGVGWDEDGEIWVSGEVVLDSADLGPALARPDGAAQVRAVIQHELGHVVGLGHVPDKSQLMADTNDGHVLDWGAGDLRGLHALGTGDCHPEI